MRPFYILWNVPHVFEHVVNNCIARFDTFEAAQKEADRMNWPKRHKKVWVVIKCEEVERDEQTKSETC